MRLKTFFVAAMMGVLAVPVLAGGVITVRTEKGGKALLVVDDETVRTEAGAKPVLVIDGPNILTEKGGTRVFFMDGDILHVGVPEGPVGGYIDGRHIKTQPGGAEMFYINGKEIKPNHDGKVLYYMDGEVLNNQQVMAVLYTLQPETFVNVPKGAGAGIPAAPAAVETPMPTDKVPLMPQAAAKDFAGGNFSIADFTSSDGVKKTGKVNIVKVGEVYVLDMKFAEGDAWQGVAVQEGGELWAAVGPVNTVGLAIYDVHGGTVTGTWMNATGSKASFGSEDWSGGEKFGGAYTITAAKAPFMGAAYVGTVAVDGADKKLGDAEAYNVAWDLSGYKVKGVGFYAGNQFAAVSSTGADFGIVRFKIDGSGGLKGEFYTAGKASGAYTLTKE